MEAKTNYALVGLIVVLLTLGLIISGLWLSVGLDYKKYDIYAVYMKEGVSGLSEDSLVKFNGVQVGFVLKIKLNPNNPQQVKLLLNIVEGTPITTSTVATLTSQGITGVTYVSLSAKSSDLTLLQKTENEPYPIIPSKPSLFNQLDQVVREVSKSIHQVSIRISDVLDEENTNNLKETFQNIETFTHSLAKNGDKLDKILSNTQVITDNFAKASKDLPPLIHDLKNSMTQIKQMMRSITEASNEVGSAMASGKNLVQKMSQQTVPTFNELIKRVDNIAVNLEKVSVDLRLNPSVILRGTTPPKPGPGE